MFFWYRKVTHAIHIVCMYQHEVIWYVFLGFRVTFKRAIDTHGGFCHIDFKCAVCHCRPVTRPPTRYRKIAHTSYIDCLFSTGGGKVSLFDKEK
jgi:hypothetical protein